MSAGTQIDRADREKNGDRMILFIKLLFVKVIHLTLCGLVKTVKVQQHSAELIRKISRTKRLGFRDQGRIQCN